MSEISTSVFRMMPQGTIVLNFAARGQSKYRYALCCLCKAYQTGPHRFYGPALHISLLQDAAQGARFSAHRLVGYHITGTSLCTGYILRDLSQKAFSNKPYVICTDLCSNLGSALRLEKRLNEIVAIPVYRKPLGPSARSLHDDKPTMSAET